MTADEIREVIEAHRRWLQGEPDGRRADLAGADLRGANLRDVNLRGADIRGADIRDVNLRGADIRGANLRDVNLRGADIRGASLPSPQMVLMSEWRRLSDDLTRDLMRYDAASHPEGEAAFSRWAADGPCPYDGCHIERAALFTEHRKLWSPGPPPRPYELMERVLDECCPGWRDDR